MPCASDSYILHFPVKECSRITKFRISIQVGPQPIESDKRTGIILSVNIPIFLHVTHFFNISKNNGLNFVTCEQSLILSSNE